MGLLRQFEATEVSKVQKNMFRTEIVALAQCVVHLSIGKCGKIEVQSVSNWRDVNCHIVMILGLGQRLKGTIMSHSREASNSEGSS